MSRSKSYSSSSSSAAEVSARREEYEAVCPVYWADPEGDGYRCVSIALWCDDSNSVLEVSHSLSLFQCSSSCDFLSDCNSSSPLGEVPNPPI